MFAYNTFEKLMLIFKESLLRVHGSAWHIMWAEWIAEPSDLRFYMWIWSGVVHGDMNCMREHFLNNYHE